MKDRRKLTSESVSQFIMRTKIATKTREIFYSNSKQDNICRNVEQNEWNDQLKRELL